MSNNTIMLSGCVLIIAVFLMFEIGAVNMHAHTLQGEGKTFPSNFQIIPQFLQFPFINSV